VAHWSRTVVLLAFSAVAAIAAGKSALDKPTLEAYLRHLNLWNPQITVAISDPKPSQVEGFMDVHVKASLGGRSLEADYLVSKDGQKILQANIYDISKAPFADDMAQIKTTGHPEMGKPSALVQIALFSDLQCSFCKELAKTLHNNLLKTFPDKVHLVFKDLPLDSIHPWARGAAVAGRCVYRQKPEAFWTYHDWMFEHQAEITVENRAQKFTEWAKTAGLDTLQLNQCVADPTAAADVNRSMVEAQALKVNSTPTMFINGRKVPGNVPWPDLKSIIEVELKHAESCCSVELPSAPARPAPSLANPKRKP
jgi:protein-disulfide isomerase